MMDRHPKRWPLATNPDNRTNVVTKDGRLVNAYTELDPESKDYWVEKRPGTANAATFSGFGTVARGMGLYNNAGSSFNSFYTIFDNVLRKNNVVMAGGPINNGGIYRFQQSRTAGIEVVFKNQSNAYYSDGALIVAISGGYPVSTVDGIAYLNGTYYVMTPTGDIRGSNIDDPTVWNALNSIIARADTDAGVAIRRHMNYILAFKRNTLEVFYDAGNAAGSPLAQVQGALFYYGCTSSLSIQFISGTSLWVTNSKEFSPKVARLDDLNLSIISTPPVERLIASGNVSNSWAMGVGGHRFYGIGLQDPAITLVYDLDQNMWYEWQSHTNTALPWVQVLQDGAFPYAQFSDSSFAPGSVYQIGPDYTYPSDSGNLFSVDIYTPRIDFGTMRRKTLFNLFFNSEQIPGSILQARCTDDDYQSFSNFRQVNLSQVRPRLNNCGTFYHRSYHFRHRCLTRLRFKTADLDLGFGSK